MILKKKGLWRGLAFGSAMLLGVSIGASQVMETWRGELDGFFGTHSKVTVTTDDGSLWSAYTPDEEYLNSDGTGNAKAIVDAHVDLNERLSEEGSVLLKNNGALPMKGSKNVTLLGIRSEVILAGSGMGVSVPAGQVVQLADALKDRGFNVNPTMQDVYKELNKTKKLKNNDSASTKYDPKEPSLAEIGAANNGYQNSFTGYSDAAIVVVGRPNSEMGDYAPGEGGVVAGTGASTAMQLTTNEKDIINLATEKFDNVIVLVNTNSAMEIDELKHNDKIKGILWVGHPGCYGTYGIADILNGDATPSGHLYDLYAADSLSSPAMQNMGTFAYSNPSSDFDRKGSNNATNVNYLIEAEGIYTGYKYYETRYEDVVLGQGYASSTAAGAFASTGDKWDYSKEVSYGFGYGLSYTTFSQTIDKVTFKQTAHDWTADVTVTVTNTGSVKAKDVIQVYGQAPYIAGGVEKASIQLLNFIKTDELEPNNPTQYTVTVDMQNLASWDSSALDGKGSYILDEGNYYFAVGNGAHEALNNVLAKKGKTVADGMDVDGDVKKAYEFNYDYAGGTVDASTFNISKAGTQVANALQTADWNYWQPGEITYLSRNNWTATWPKTYENLTITNKDLIKAINGNVYEFDTESDVSSILYGQEGELKFAQMKGLDYDDDLWNQLLNQLDIEEALNFILKGNRTLPDMESVGFIAGRYTENGPNGIGGRGFGSISYNNFGETTPDWLIPSTDENAKFAMNIFPSAPVVASTFNPDLAYEQGRLIGNDAVFVGLPIIWGPGMNTHRHPYNGRSGEYYSEDGVLLGVMGMEFAVGALDKGLIAAPKHYAFNDQEAHRVGIAPYMTEQKAREGELRGYQIAFEATKYDKLRNEDVGMLGTMTSFSKIGPTEVTCSKGMIKDILRGEWGFNGYIVSDMSDDTDLLTECLVAGLSSYDAQTNFNNAELLEKYKSDATVLQAIKDAIHYDLYVLANSNYMNGVNTSSYSKEVIVGWRAAYISAITVTAALTLASVALWTVSIIKTRKEEE